MIRTILLASTLFTFLQVNAQCISKFPYTQDFENFDSLQTLSSCDLSLTGDTADGWKQDPNDAGEWRADTAGTGSVGTGPGATSTTSGVGVGTDYLPGTTRGKYLYTEATSTNPCTNVSVGIISPCFDFSTKGKYYRLTFAYHMYGAGMGSLHVDVYDGTNWVNSVWKIAGDQGSSWKTDTVNLAKYNGSSVQIRIRAVMGNTFQSDCAIDAVTVEAYNPPDYDALVESISFTPTEYFYIPLKHVKPLTFTTKVRNEGLKSITGTKVHLTAGNYTDSSSIGTIAALSKDSTTFSTTYKPTTLGNGFVQMTVTINEKDGDTTNNSKLIETNINKSVYSRENGVVSGGVGFATGNGEIGQMFELLKDDTLSSVSFYLNSPAAGDSMKVKLYQFSTVPGALITTTKSAVASGSAEWKTVRFDCEQILTAGKYFVAVEQLVASSNMSLAYNYPQYKQNTAFFWGGTTWTELGTGGIPACVLVRMNLNGVEKPIPTISSVDTICQSELVLAKGSGAATYQWGPSGIVKTPTAFNTYFTADTSFVLSLTGTNACGYSTTVKKPIHVKVNPTATVNKDTTVCKNQNVTLKVSTNNNYKWVGGTANGNYSVNPNKSSTYKVDVDSSNGCKKQFEVFVSVSIPIPKTNNDTTVCEAQPINLVASGGKTYQWIGGPSTATYVVKPRSDQKYIVTVTDDYGCSENDTVGVTILAGPPLKTSNDTAICFGQKIAMIASGAQTYKWTDGPATATYSTFPIFNKSYIVKGTGSNGCYLTDSVVVSVASIPKVDVRNDTTICEGASVKLEAKTADQVTFNWSSGESTQTITKSPKVQSKYIVKVENTTGCFAEDSVTISVNPQPILKVSYVLNKRDVTFSNTSLNAKTHAWDFGDGETSTVKSEFHKYAKDGDYTVKYTVTNDCGSKDTTFTIKIENLGMNDLVFDNLTIQPNPTSSNALLKFSNDEFGKVIITVIDINGKVVKEINALKSSQTFEAEISLNGFQDGLYLIHITGQSGTTTKRLILNK